MTVSLDLSRCRRRFCYHQHRKLPILNSFAPLAQLAEQVTLNCGRSWAIRPTLPNTLRNSSNAMRVGTSSQAPRLFTKRPNCKETARRKTGPLLSCSGPVRTDRRPTTVPVFLRLKIERCRRDLRSLDGPLFRVLQRLERRRLLQFLEERREIAHVGMRIDLALNRPAPLAPFVANGTESRANRTS